MNSRFTIVLTAALLAFAACRQPEPTPPPPAVRLAFAMPPGVEPGFGDETLDAAISPDESQVVFVATDALSGVRRLWRRALDGERTDPLAGTEGAQQPAWKRTGNVLSFFAEGRLKLLTLGDGAVHDLADAPSPSGAAWLQDGSLVFGTGSGVLRRVREGQVSDATTLAPGEVSHLFPAVTDTSDFIYVAVRDDGRRVVRVAGAGAERELTTTSGHAAMIGDHLVHVRDGVLLAYERNRETGTLSSRGIPIGLDVGVSAAGRALFAGSPRLMLHAPAAPRATEVMWLDMSGARGTRVADAGDYWQVRLSPDDRRVAVSVMDPLLHSLDVATVAADAGGILERLTLALAADTDPVWSPDASRVLFRSMEGGTPNLFARRIGQKEGASEPVLRTEMDETPTDWLEGRVLFYARTGGSSDAMVLQTSSGTYEAVAATPFNETDARWSPDGRWIAYVSDESGRPDVYARRPDGSRVRVSFAGGRRPRWSRDGGAILFLRSTQVMRAELTAGNPPQFSPARVLFDAPGIRDFDAAHRSDRLIALLPVDPETRPAVSAIWNWKSLVGAP